MRDKNCNVARKATTENTMEKHGSDVRHWSKRGIYNFRESKRKEIT